MFDAFVFVLIVGQPLGRLVDFLDWVDKRSWVNEIIGSKPKPWSNNKIFGKVKVILIRQVFFILCLIQPDIFLSSLFVLGMGHLLPPAPPPVPPSQEGAGGIQSSFVLVVT